MDFPLQINRKGKKGARGGGENKKAASERKLGQRQRAAARFRLRMFESRATC